MTKMEKAKKFVQKHKKEIILTGVSAVGGAVVYKVTRDRRVARQVKNLKSKLKVDDFIELSKISNNAWGIFTDGSEYKLADFGRAGEDIIKSCTDPKINPETVVTGGIVFGKV